MNRKRFGVMICVPFLVLIIVWAMSGMLNIRKQEKLYHVSVILSDSYNDRWAPVKKGLELAAGDHNIVLNYVYTGEFGNVQEELDLIKREVDNGADGIVARLVSSEVSKKELERALSKAELVLLESDIEEGSGYPVVGADYYKIGRTLSEVVIDDLGEQKEGIRIGVVSDSLSLLSARRQLEGLRKALLESGLEPVWTISRDDADMEEKLRAGAEQADVFIALGSRETESVVDYLESIDGEHKEYILYGEGYSEKAVYYLDKGVVRILAVPDEFNTGYQSMGMIAERLQRNTSDHREPEIEFNVLDQSNMYEEENQKVVFPIVQ